MASVYRQDTGELLGYLTEPEGPFPGGITYWPFKAWSTRTAAFAASGRPAWMRRRSPSHWTFLCGITTAPSYI
jgi:hypothetical protein